MEEETVRRWAGEVYRGHRERIRRRIQRLGVPARDAEDVAQEVFVAVLRGSRRYDPNRPLGPWLQAITYRTARDHLRRGHSREVLAEIELDRADPSALPDERCAGAERLSRVLTLWHLLRGKKPRVKI